MSDYADIDTMRDVYMSKAQREAYDRIVARAETVKAMAEALEGMIESYQYEASMENPALIAAHAAISAYRGESK